MKWSYCGSAIFWMFGAIFVLSTGVEAKADPINFHFAVSGATLIEGSSIAVFPGGYMDYSFSGDLSSTGLETLTYSGGDLYPGDAPGTLTSPGIVNGARIYTETSSPTNSSMPYQISFTVPDPATSGIYFGYGDVAVESFSNLIIDGMNTPSISAPLTLTVAENISVCFAGPCLNPPPPTAATPEPSALLLVVTGIGGLVCRRRFLRG